MMAARGNAIPENIAPWQQALKKYAPAGGRRAQHPEAGGETAVPDIGRWEDRPKTNQFKPSGDQR